MKEDKHHIVSYTTYIVILAILLVLTAITIIITRFEMGPFNTTAAMLIAGIKGLFVLLFFMHLKFESRFYQIMVTAVIVIFLLVLFVTFFDYSYRI